MCISSHHVFWSTRAEPRLPEQGLVQQMMSRPWPCISGRVFSLTSKLDGVDRHEVRNKDKSGLMSDCRARHSDTLEYSAVSPKKIEVRWASLATA
jgi:hypothetical protein